MDNVVVAVSPKVPVTFNWKVLARCTVVTETDAVVAFAGTVMEAGTCAAGGLPAFEASVTTAPPAGAGAPSVATRVTTDPPTTEAAGAPLASMNASLLSKICGVIVNVASTLLS